jgi:superfamily II DNA or RNA helicase
LQDLGFDAKNINTKLYEFQQYIVELSCKKGRFGVFAGTGTGKTAIQCEIARQHLERFNKPQLILAPLAVSMQTIQEAQKFDIEVKKFSGDYQNEIYISNYDNMHNIDFSKFQNILLDESSIIKHYGGKIRDNIIEVGKFTNSKFCFTATPSPNDITELTNYSEFLSVMKRSEMLSKYFIHDSGKTSDWRLKKHSVNDFFEFLTQWSVMYQSPKDIGFNDDRFILPELKIKEHFLQTQSDGLTLFNDIAVSAINHNQTMRKSLELRMQKTAYIANKHKEQIIIWIKLNDEGEYLRKLIPDAIEVKGNDSVEDKERNLIGFANNQFRVLITKPKIAQFGLNFQNCARQIFASPDYSFESLYQAIRRSYRYGQKNTVNIDIIAIDTIQNVIKALHKKENSFIELQKQYNKIYQKQLRKAS